jgi:hypothetical protein
MMAVSYFCIRDGLAGSFHITGRQDVMKVQVMIAQACVRWRSR